MSEWWTYRPGDMLLFSPRVYWRMFELQNAAVWPLQLVTLIAGLAMIFLIVARPNGHQRWIAFVLAVLWVFVGWTFLWYRYAAINWAMSYVAPLFALQSILAADRNLCSQWARLWAPRSCALERRSPHQHRTLPVSSTALSFRLFLAAGGDFRDCAGSHRYRNDGIVADGAWQVCANSFCGSRTLVSYHRIDTVDDGIAGGMATDSSCRFDARLGGLDRTNLFFSWRDLNGDLDR